MTVEITTDAVGTFINGTPIFGASANARLGQMKITTNPGTNESSAFIYA